MSIGTVKWFNTKKGYGFIQPEDNTKDVFIHASALERAGIRSLRDGQRIEYEIISGKDGRSSADNIVTLD